MTGADLAANVLAMVSMGIGIATAETLGARVAITGGTRRERVILALLFGSTSIIGITIACLTSVYGALPAQIYWLYRHLRNAKDAR